MVGKTDAEIAALAPVQSVAGLSGAVSPSGLKSAISLDNVTNDAQTKAAIVPNAPPAAGQLLVGNASGTAYGVVSASGDATISSTGVITVSKVNGSTLGTMATQNANAVSINGGTISGTAISVSTPVNSTDPVSKAYADALAAGRGLFQSDIDCSANPNYPAAEKGWQYCVTVAGKIGGASGPDVEIGDTIQAKANVSAGNHAIVGTSWFILQGNLVGALRASNNLSDVTSASTALGNLGGQAASGNLTATITTNTPVNASGVLIGNGTDVGFSSSAINNTFLVWRTGLGYVWSAMTNSLLGAVTNNASVMTGANIDAAKLGTGVVDNNEFNRLNGGTEDIQPRLDTLKVETLTIHIAAPAVTTIYIDAKAEYYYTINSVKGIKTTAGTATVAVKINGTAVSGLSAISVTTTAQDVAASGVNVVVSPGDLLTFEITAVSSAANLICNIKATRS